MQKINIILPVLFLTSFYLQAAPTDTASASQQTTPTEMSGKVATTVSAPVTAGQDQLVKSLQDDIAFERQKRQLSNELALEKLRAELQKVRGESTPTTIMPVTPPTVTQKIEKPFIPSIPQVRTVAPPSVVLVSQVAGVTRVGVSINGQIQLVGRHEIFSANGRKYQLEPTKNNMLVAKEVK